MIERMTTHHVRTHFFFCSIVKELYDGLDGVNVGVATGRKSSADTQFKDASDVG